MESISEFTLIAKKLNRNIQIWKLLPKIWDFLLCCYRLTHLVLVGSGKMYGSSFGYRNQPDDSLITRLSKCYDSLQERGKRSSSDFNTLVSEIQKLDAEFQRQLDLGYISKKDKKKYEVCMLCVYYG